MTSILSSCCCNIRRRPGGFTLVELMISLAIGLLILSALVFMFVNTSSSSRELARTNSMIENGRLTAQLLENEIMHAGFWGSAVPQFEDLTLLGAPQDVPTEVPDPCLAFDPADWTIEHVRNLVGIPLQAYSDPAVCAAIITDRVANTDVLVVRYAERCEPGEGNCLVDTPGQVYFQASRCGLDLEPYVLGVAGFDLLQRDCSTTSERRLFVSNIYYVRNFAVAPDDQIPTLVRSVFAWQPGQVPQHQPPVTLVEGIDVFRVELGIDSISRGNLPVENAAAVVWQDPENRRVALNRGDGAPDGPFRRCDPDCTVDELINVTAVRFYVLARSRDASPGYVDSKIYDVGGLSVRFDDGFKRHLFSSTAQLPNVAGRRATP